MHRWSVNWCSTVAWHHSARGTLTAGYMAPLTLSLELSDMVRRIHQFCGRIEWRMRTKKDVPSGQKSCQRVGELGQGKHMKWLCKWSEGMKVSLNDCRSVAKRWIQVQGAQALCAPLQSLLAAEGKEARDREGETFLLQSSNYRLIETSCLCSAKKTTFRGGGLLLVYCLSLLSG